MTSKVRRAKASELSSVLDLIQQQFSYMDGRVDPPSSMHDLKVDDLAGQDVWVVGEPLRACMILSSKEDHLYLGKVAIRPDCRGKGLLRELIKKTENIASQYGFKSIVLESRIELMEVHRAFSGVGFVEIGRGSHKGFDRDTYIIMERRIG